MNTKPTLHSRQSIDSIKVFFFCLFYLQNLQILNKLDLHIENIQIGEFKQIILYNYHFIYFFYLELLQIWSKLQYYYK